jgi:hypothetical protein
VKVKDVLNAYITAPITKKKKFGLSMDPNLDRRPERKPLLLEPYMD